MWSRVALCLLVATAFASNSPAWKDNTEYVYTVRGRSLTSLDKVSDQYSGVQIKSKLMLSMKPSGVLQGRISEPQYAQIHTRLPHGFNQYIPDQELNYKQLPWSDKPFEMEMEDGSIRSLIVEKSLKRWEVNLIKSIVSQFQLDVNGKNAIENPINIRGKQNDAVFKTMEETISGRTETLYDIHEMPEFVIPAEPELVPQPHLKNEGHIIEVIKTQNFTNSLERPSYHFGLKGLNGELTNNVVEDFLSRTSNTRAILTGQLPRFIVQSIFSVEKILVTPTENEHDMGSVQTALNISLVQVQARNSQPQDLSNPIDVGSLVYSFENPNSNEITGNRYSSGEYDSKSDESQESNEHQRHPRSLRGLLTSRRQQKQPSPRMEESPELPLLPNFMGYQGKSIKENRDFNIRENIRKIVKEIEEELKDSDKVLEKSTLSKYTVLTSFIRLMNEEELKSTAEEIYSKSQQEGQKDMWPIFRDAVAEAGTGPAFLTIQQWIETKKITHEEAGFILSTMAASIRTPTVEYMRKFFELVRSHNVVSQSGLNETALLSYSNLVNQVYVNKNISHNQYPVHSFGNFRTQEGKQMVKETIIPYLSQQLDKAIREADTRKIHVYIRALGNVGHKNILSAFEKYLEGKQQCSQFQRLMMVVSLDKLATSYPQIARAVLYRLYQNTQEIHHIRIAAVYQIIRTNPPKELLQRMAITTNFDRAEQVNAAVKSVIESLSQLKNPRHEQLRQGGQAAKHLLKKRIYGIQNSMLLKDFVVEQTNQELVHSVQSMARSESYLPNILKYTLGTSLNHMNQQLFSLEYMVSSVKSLWNAVEEQSEDYQRQRSERSQQGSEKKWSSANVADLLRLDLGQKEQLEGFIYSEMGPISQIWSYDNRSLERLPELIREKLESIQNGKHFTYTKMGHSQQKALSFPTILGLPFVYTYDVPLLMKIQGKVKMLTTPELVKSNKFSRPDEVTGELESDVILSSKIESHVSFVTPFDHQQYISGFTRNLQFSVPLKASFKIDLQNQETKIEIDTAKSDQRRMVHYSTWPYTARSDILTSQPVASRPNTHIIKKENQRFFKTVIGQKSTGVALKVWGNHPEQSLNIAYLSQVFRSEGLVEAWKQLIRGNQMEQCEFNIGVLPQETETQRITIRLGHKSKYFTSQGKREEHLSQWLNEDRSEPSTRLQKMLELASSEVKSSDVRAYDVAVEFQGERSQKYSATFGMGKSNVYPGSNVLAFLRKSIGEEVSQAGFELRSEIKNTNGLDLHYSLQNDPSAKMEYKLFYQPKDQQRPSEIKGTVQMKRTENRKQYLVEQPEYHECKKEMQRGNQQLSACLNMTIRANIFDKVEIEFRPENWDQKIVRAVKEIYQGAQWYYLPSTTVTEQRGEDKVIRMELKFQPNFRNYNLSVQTAQEKVKIQDLPINEIAKTLVQIHPVYHLGARLTAKLVAFENLRPSCVLDRTAARTFDKFSYPANLDNEWTVMMQYAPQQARYHQQSVSQQLKKQIENYVVLVRQQSEQEKQVKIVFNSRETQGNDVEIDMEVNNGQVSVTHDEQQVSLSESQSTDLYKGYVQIYKLPNQEVKIEFGKVFYILYDGQRIRITATSDKLRQSVVGMCGRFDDSLFDELQTPENCVVRNPKELIESYKVSQNKRSFESSQCSPLEFPRYVNVISQEGAEQPWEQVEQSQGQEEIQLRQRYVEEEDQICFTTRPVPVCKNGAVETTSREVPVHCVANLKTAALFKKQIQRGGNPDFSHKSTTKMVRMNIDRQCA